MRPAINKTKKARFDVLEEQTNRACRTSAWILRNVEDKHKPHFKVILEHLKTATEDIAIIRDRVMPDWSEPELPLSTQKALQTLSQILPEAKPGELRKLVAKLSNDLNGSGSSSNAID